MIDAMHHIRKAIIDRLTGNITHNGSPVSIYNVIPKNASYPLIRIYSVSSNEIDQNQTTFNSEILTRVEVVTRFSGDDGGELSANRLISDCLNLLRTRSDGYFDLSANGLKVYVVENNGITYLTDNFSDHTYHRAIMDLSVINKKPIGNGIITCLNMKQAKIRRKKGAEAADAVNSVLSQK